MINSIFKSGMKMKVNRFLYALVLGISFLFFISSCKTIKTSSKPSPQKPVVTIPDIQTPPVTDTKPEKSKDVVKRRFALIMPFELEQNFKSEEDVTSAPEVNPASLNAINFYEGAMMAVDSLKSNKVEIKLNSYDTPSDSIEVVRMLTNAAIKEADMVFATFPNNLAAVAAGVARQHNIKLVLTQAGTPDILNNNANVALAFASTKTQCREMVGIMLEQFNDANIILVFRTIRREDELADVFRQEIVKRKGTSEFHEFNATKKEYKEVTGLISKSRRNIIFLISSDEAFVSPVLTLLEDQKIFGIKISGLPTWLNFESIDFSIFNNLQIHLFDNNFIEVDLVYNSLFRKLFISRFQMDPMPAAYNGFDMIYNVGLALKENYSGMDKLMKSSFQNRTQTYDFTNTVPGGVENKSISVLRIVDYKLERFNK